MPIDAFVGDDGKLGGVDRVSALAEKFSLRAFLAAAQKEFSCVLEIRLVLGIVGAEHLRRPKRRAVAREHIRDLALSDRDEIRPVDAIHEGEKQMQTATQDLGLEARFAAQRDESRLDRAARRP